MRWLQVAVVVLSVVTMAGCPSEFGKDGRVGKAVHKDAQHPLGLTRCEEKYWKEVCAPGRENSAECRRCGGP